MRIDREAFLLAVSALAGCEQDLSTRSAPVEPIKPQRPAITMRAVREPVVTPTPAPEPVAPVVEVNRPVAPTRRRQTPQQWFHGLSMGQRTNVTSVCQARREHTCREVLKALMPPPPTRTPSLDDDDPAPQEVAVAEKPENPEDKLKAMSGKDRAQVSAYCDAEFAPHCETPLVVAFDAQPIEFAAAGGDRFAFVPGAPAATDWPTAVTPWIALDLDGDGAITSGAELFGSSTVLPGGALAPNGFAALAVLDSNGDGTLDARDPMFSRLVLWSDRNGDHRSSPDELRPLASTITALALAHGVDARCNDRDDCEGERGTLQWRDTTGATHVGAIVDIYVRSR